MSAALLNGLVAGCAYALLAFGFGLVYFTTGVFHFAHGAAYALAGYGGWFAFTRLHWPLGIALAVGLALAVLLGWLVESALYRPLRAQRAPVDVLFLTSLGVYTVAANGLALAFGHEAQVFGGVARRSFVLREAPEPGLPPLVVTQVQIVTVVASVVVFGLLWLLLTRTRFGLALRAVAANPQLAEVVGIDTRRLLPRVVALGSALGGVAALCVAADVGVNPEMGLAAVVTGAVAVVVGGVGSLPGTALAGLLLGLLQHLGRFWIKARWEDALTFTLILIVLLVRPRGLFGAAR